MKGLSLPNYNQDDADDGVAPTAGVSAVSAETEELMVSGEIDGEGERKQACLDCSKRVGFEKTKLRRRLGDPPCETRRWPSKTLRSLPPITRRTLTFLICSTHASASWHR